MAETVSVEIAKAQFKQIIERVEAGETIVISRKNVAIAQLVPVSGRGTRQFGAMRGKIALGAEFFEPLPDTEWPLA
jgi:prevent-host-death family protein